MADELMESGVLESREPGVLESRDFYDFTRALRIDSKETGLVSLGACLLGSQDYVLKKMQAGIKDGCHEFVTLKCRQIGISTISLAMDLYWVYANSALSGAIVTHDEGARNSFRTTLALYRAGLAEEWQREVLDDNRDQLVFDNGSRLRFLVAGTRARSSGSSKLGRSGALVLCHATEVAYWGDPSGIDALRASFAQANPNRLYHWESTANGENWFRDMWREAKGAKSIRPIFVSWWANDGYYGLPRESALYREYWSGKMTREEASISKDVLARYGEQINDCQWAWYRYMAAERITDEAQLSQEFPHREEDAFISTGAAFFRSGTLADLGRMARARKKSARFYRVEFGTEFSQTKVDRCQAARANLIVWAEPADDGWYVLGVDPAFASNPDSNRSVVSVWRCWYNRLEQVAEFCDHTVSTHAVAWAMTYLAGHYGRTTVNLELTGPGGAVLQEFQNMRRAAYSANLGLADKPEAMRKVVGAIRQYLYRRIDSTNGTSSFIHTKTTLDVKERMMNGLRDYMERGCLVPGSEELIEECRVVRRTDGGAPEAPGGQYDDRVIAAALACMCWNDQLRAQLLAQGVVWQEKVAREGREPNPVDRIVSRYLTRIGIVPPGGPPPPKKTAIVGQKKWSGKMRDRLNRAENSRSG
jgi:hypothetical protein